MAERGITVNYTKNRLVPTQESVFLGIALNSVTMRACPSPRRVDNILELVAQVRGQTGLTYGLLLSLLGKLVSVSEIVPPGLLSLRPLQVWINGLGLDPKKHQRRRAVYLALRQFLPALRGRHVLVRSDSTSAVYQVNHQGGVRSKQSLQEAQRLLRWAFPCVAPEGPGSLMDGSEVTMWPNPTFLPKRLSAFHVNQPVRLSAYTPQPVEGRQPESGLLCPVRALRRYVDVTDEFRRSDALFLCYGGDRKGCALSKQRLSHWIVDAVLQAYKAKGLPAPPVRCHSTRGVSASWAALKGVPLMDICAAATWASPCTFARFYRVNVAAHHQLAAAVLSASSACD